MRAQPLASLDTPALARRLGELASDERRVQVEFLVHLDEFDRRRAWLVMGFGSLWTYCLEALHLREGAAGRRIAAMKVLRRFPHLAGALRDGRLCLSTLAQLGSVLDEDNAEVLVARAAYRTAAEVDHLVASLRPRQAPREGVRKLPEPGAPGAEPASASPAASAEPASASPAGTAGEAAPRSTPSVPGQRLEEASPSGLVPTPLTVPRLVRLDPRPSEVRAISESQWSLRVTIDRTLKEDLEALAQLLSHKLPRGDLAAVLREAVRCGIQKHGKRKGAVKPARQVRARAPGDPTAIPASVRRQVWERDDGRCAWVGPDGRRCNSRWRVEVDHVDPAARGGKATLDRLRLLCRAHNTLYAEQVYGAKVMARYRKGESTIDVDSAGSQDAAARDERPALRVPGPAPPGGALGAGVFA